MSFPAEAHFKKHLQVGYKRGQFGRKWGDQEGQRRLGLRWLKGKEEGLLVFWFLVSKIGEEVLAVLELEEESGERYKKEEKK